MKLHKKIAILLATTILAATITACKKCELPLEPENINPELELAQKQFTQDYSNVTTFAHLWAQHLNYQVVSFRTYPTTPTDNTSTHRAWYAIHINQHTKDTTANRQKAINYTGTLLPKTIEQNFNATKYNDPNRWAIHSIYREINAPQYALDRVYTVTLTPTPNPETDPTASCEKPIQLHFDATLGDLIFTAKDAQITDFQNLNHFVIPDSLLYKAVQSTLPGSKIVFATKFTTDQKSTTQNIEVRATLTIPGQITTNTHSINSSEKLQAKAAKSPDIHKEYRLVYDNNLQLLAQHTIARYEVLYFDLPAEFSAIGDWFADPTNSHTPPPPVNTIAEITEQRSTLATLSTHHTRIHKTITTRSENSNAHVANGGTIEQKAWSNSRTSLSTDKAKGHQDRARAVINAHAECAAHTESCEQVQSIDIIDGKVCSKSGLVHSENCGGGGANTYSKSVCAVHKKSDSQEYGYRIDFEYISGSTEHALTFYFSPTHTLLHVTHN